VGLLEANEPLVSFASLAFLPKGYPPMTNLEAVFHKVDWTLLAQQKLTLLRAMNLLALSGNDIANNLSGVLHFLDAVQDAAKADNFPVVFLTDEDDE
jgi:hypothetical protein